MTSVTPGWGPFEECDCFASWVEAAQGAAAHAAHGSNPGVTVCHLCEDVAGPLSVCCVLSDGLCCGQITSVCVLSRVIDAACWQGHLERGRQALPGRAVLYLVRAFYTLWRHVRAICQGCLGFVVGGGRVVRAEVGGGVSVDLQRPCMTLLLRPLQLVEMNETNAAKRGTLFALSGVVPPGRWSWGLVGGIGVHKSSTVCVGW